MEIFAYEFMQRAFLAGLMVSLLCSFMAFFVVLKRMAFVGVGISHSAFGGVALGILLNVNPILMAAAFSLLVSWLIGLVSKQGALHEDTAIGIFFSAAMALGVALISLSGSYNVDLFGYLFGNILSVTTGDLWLVGILGFLALSFLVLFFKEFLYLSFDEEMARVNGLPVTFLNYLLLTLMAVTVVVSIKVVGIVLAEALLVIPAATGYQLARHYRLMLAISLLCGTLSSVMGLWLSYRYDLASGATIVLCATLFFFLALLFSPRRGLVSRLKKQGNYSGG